MNCFENCTGMAIQTVYRTIYKSCSFQYNGAPPHFTWEFWQIARNGAIYWPHITPNFNPNDFLLWDYFEGKKLFSLIFKLTMPHAKGNINNKHVVRPQTLSDIAKFVLEIKDEIFNTYCTLWKLLWINFHAIYLDYQLFSFFIPGVVSPKLLP